MQRTITAAALGLTLLLAGCKDLGLAGNVPADQDGSRPMPELVTEVMAPADVDALRLIVDGRLWLASGPPITYGTANLRAIGSAAGRTVYARAWDQPPYGAVYTQLPAPSAIDGLTPRDAMDAGTTRWQLYAPVVGR